MTTPRSATWASCSGPAPCRSLSPTRSGASSPKCARTSRRLVVFDTWQRCLGADENDTADVSRAITALDRIRDTLGCAELVLHHTRVDEDRERGSTALRASRRHHAGAPASKTT